jgi:ParB family chromosome partitioning protein
MAKKASFTAASFSNLRAAAGEGAGEPLRITLVDIDEDPNQPRRSFDQAELESLALTIRERGVLQPIGVKPPEDGRYMLVFGARRLRASKLAGQADIAAVIVPDGQRDYATQVIENQQRANLSNSELAAAVNQLHREGKQGKEIATICNLKDYQIAAFRAVEKLPDFLAVRLDNGDMRAIYDLYRTWQKHPAQVEDAMPDADTFLTITEARRIIGAVTGKATGSVILDREQVPEVPAPVAPQIAPTSVFVPPQAPADRPTGSHHSAALPDMAEQPTPQIEAQTAPPAQPLRDVAQPATRPTHPGDLHGANPGASEHQDKAQVEPVTQADPQPDDDTPSLSISYARGEPMFVMETLAGIQGVLILTDRPDVEDQVFLDVNGDWLEVPFAELRGISAR